MKRAIGLPGCTRRNRADRDSAVRPLSTSRCIYARRRRFRPLWLLPACSYSSGVRCFNCSSGVTAGTVFARRRVQATRGETQSQKPKPGNEEGCP